MCTSFLLAQLNCVTSDVRRYVCRTKCPHVRLNPTVRAHTQSLFECASNFRIDLSEETDIKLVVTAWIAKRDSNSPDRNPRIKNKQFIRKQLCNHDIVYVAEWTNVRACHALPGVRDSWHLFDFSWKCVFIAKLLRNRARRVSDWAPSASKYLLWGWIVRWNDPTSDTREWLVNCDTIIGPCCR